MAVPHQKGLTREDETWFGHRINTGGANRVSY